MVLSLPGSIVSLLRIRVAIPHFFQEEESDGYGSSRRGNRLSRSLALARCLGGLLSLNRSPRDLILNLAEQHLEYAPRSVLPGLPGVLVDLHLFVCGEYWIHEVVELYSNRLQLHRLDLKDPRQLPLESVRQLLDMPTPADLSLYMEDDLVIQDPRYADKLAWFYKRTQNKVVLMPHRREPSLSNAPQRLYVDGPIKEESQKVAKWASDEKIVANGRFWNGQEVCFVEASNPHSGSFCVSASQLKQLRISPWPPEAFVGPLETAATGTIISHFPVLKPSWACREFLELEHGNPSFLGFIDELPRREQL